MKKRRDFDSALPNTTPQAFGEVLAMMQAARVRTLNAVNTAHFDL